MNFAYAKRMGLRNHNRWPQRAQRDHDHLKKSLATYKCVTSLQRVIISGGFFGPIFEKFNLIKPFLKSLPKP